MKIWSISVLRGLPIGSYAGAGYLLSTLNGQQIDGLTGYARWLDLDAALARTRWIQGNATYLR